MEAYSEDDHIKWQMNERPEITCSEWVEEWQRRIAAMESAQSRAMWGIVTHSRHIERCQESIEAYKRAIKAANSSTVSLSDKGSAHT